MKDSIKLSLKCLCMVDLDFCITYMKNTKFNLVTVLFNNNQCTQLTAAQIIQI